ncbi:MAG: hypothetical protein EZS28_051283 [Streblomastix strix]|uniref:Uncharacterized protein n=1 Tax=Streblomastix strix TaxID=222440 RepID=A0A5J4T661_9EUKA|nr:MAG: hypothetical protein EZS28_051283 [Streblomastix strix]
MDLSNLFKKWSLYLNFIVMFYVRISLSVSFRNLDPSILVIVSSLVGIYLLGGPEVKQGDSGISNHYPVSPGDEDNNWLSPSLLILPIC